MFCRNCGKDVVETAEICPSCGAKPLAGKVFCPSCGAPTTAITEMCTKCGTRLMAAPAGGPMVAPRTAPMAAAPMDMSGVSPKSRLIATLLAAFVGELGVHRFYLGKIGTGVVQVVLTAVVAPIFFAIGLAFAPVAILASLIWSGVGIWVFVDFIFIVIGRFKDKNGLLIFNWSTPK